MHRKALPLDPWPNSTTGGTRWGAWPGARPGAAGKPGLGQGGLDERAVQPHADRRYLPGRAPGLLPRLRVALPEGRRDHLLDERHLALDRGPDGPQVPGLDAIPAEHGGGRRDLERVPLVHPPGPADQPEVLQLGKLLLLDPRGGPGVAAAPRDGI